MTFPDPVRSNHGPDKDPVGLGVAISNILLKSSLSDRHSCEAGVAAEQQVSTILASCVCGRQFGRRRH